MFGKDIAYGVAYNGELLYNAELKKFATWCFALVINPRSDIKPFSTIV